MVKEFFVLTSEDLLMNIECYMEVRKENNTHECTTFFKDGTTKSSFISKEEYNRLKKYVK